MPTVYDFFSNDDPNTMKYSKPLTLQRRDPYGVKVGEDLIIEVKIRHSTESSTRLFTVYIPECEDFLQVCLSILDGRGNFIQDAEQVIVIGGHTSDIRLGPHSQVYSNRIFVYTDVQPSEADLQAIEKYSQQHQISITIRGPQYLESRLATEIPLAFISHDSKDKEAIAKVLADGLMQRLCPVWYDEYSLSIGDSLRQSIEKGIKEAKKCILVLTPNFLSNPGWSKKEFDSIFTREMIMEEKIILPIWHGVTKKEIYDYSPSLVDYFALVWPNVDKLSEQEYKADVQGLISKIHTVLIA